MMCPIESSPTSLLMCPTLKLNMERERETNNGNPKIPKEFIWPSSDRTKALRELDAPVIDLAGFLAGDEASTLRSAELVRAACEAHGFFQIVNYGGGVESGVLNRVLECMDLFFELSHAQKLRAEKRPGSLSGYAKAHGDRFKANLPWKETLSFEYCNANASSNRAIVDYLESIYGNDFEEMGWAYQRCGDTMNKLALSLTELLAVSLGIDRFHYRKFFEGGTSIMRCNYYPTCEEPSLAMGTGPHRDPIGFTILLQDQVGGLDVFTDGQWYTVSPIPGALVVNIGDTFTALSNGRYQSCLHRALVNQHSVRKSLVLFFCPRENKIVKPPNELVKRDGGRNYPDFTWAELLDFTQKHYRTDTKTLESFTTWLQSSQRHSHIASK